MAKCQICGKRTRIGRTSRHHRGVSSRQFAKRAPKKSKAFKANIQKTTIKVGGLKMTLRLCTKCLKAIRSKGKKSLEKKDNLVSEKKIKGKINRKKTEKKAKEKKNKHPKTEKKK